MDDRDRAAIINLTDAVNKLAKSMDSSSFHQRQVPALQRQSKVLEYIKDCRMFYLDEDPSRPFTKGGILKMLDKIGDILLSS